MTKKIGVLHIVQSLETGGLENGIVNLINRSDADRFRVDVLCLREKGELADRITNKSSQVFFDGKNKVSITGAVQKVYNASKSGNYHIIHAHGWTTMLAGYIGGKLAGVPVIMNGEHGTLYFDYWHRRLMQRVLFNLMAVNLTVSAALKDEIKQRFSVSNSNFKVIINGVDTEKFQILSKEKNYLIRRSLGLSEEHFIIGCVGRLDEVKNYPSLIKVLSLLVSDIPVARVVFAGDGPMMAPLVELVGELGLSNHFIFLGRRDDIPDLMNVYDLFVQPSFREGLSNTILEAMSCGTPVVASKVGGNPEIIIEGQTGKMFPVGEVESLATIIRGYYNNREELRSSSLNARQHVVENFSIDWMVRNYQDTYIELTNMSDL